MRKLKKFLLLPIIFFLAFTLAACGNKKQNTYQKVKQDNTIVWGVRADTRLFGLMSIKTGRVEGFEIDLANAITKQMLGKNGHAKLTKITANTRIPLLKNNNVDVLMATMTITPDRQKQVLFSKPYFKAGQGILVPDNSKIKTVQQLNNKTVLAVKGTTAVANVHKYAPKAKVLEYGDYGQAFSALKAGQGVAMTTDSGLLAGIASENPGYKLAGSNFTNEPYGMAVNKGQTQMVKHINKALDELKKNGTYNRLIRKWFKGVKGFNIKEVEE